MRTAVTMLVAIVLILITVVGVYTVTESTINSGGNEAADAGGMFSQQLECAIFGGSKEECDTFETDDNGGG